MKTNYDVVIVGAGPAGIFASYELIINKPDLKVLLLEEGNDVYKRKCPIVENKSKKCVSCNPCNIMRGFGGAGAFSDGKYNFTTQFGGWLNEYLPEKEIMDLINYVDKINLAFGAPKSVFNTTNSTIKDEALKYDIHLLDASVRHLGTENNLKIMSSIYEFLKDKVEIRFKCPVDKIVDSHNVVLKNGEEISCDNLIVASGRAGASWFAEQCKAMGLNVSSNRIDLGVRVEVPASVMKHITDEVYEAKLLYRTKKYGDIVRTFCMNPNGQVVAENTNGIITVNGHSYEDKKLQSENTNFALLVSNKFTEPFKEPNKYGERIASLSNLLGDGVIVQRLGDLRKGRRTNEHRLSKSFTKPTLNATAGDLSLVLPKRHLDNILEMLEALDNIAKGINNDDTLLYGVEVKFFSSRVEIDNNLKTKNGIYAIGDGSGLTRGLSQASATGVFVARKILADIKFIERIRKLEGEVNDITGSNTALL